MAFMGSGPLFCLLAFSVISLSESTCLVQEHRLLEEWGSAADGQPTCDEVVVRKCNGWRGV